MRPTEKELQLTINSAGAVNFSTLEAAFGQASLGILIVKDLPAGFQPLRLRLLSHASYLANLPSEELGKNQHSPLDWNVALLNVHCQIS